VRGWLFGLLLLAATPCARAVDALQTIDECLGRLDAATDVGYARIAARCPELSPALLQSPAAAWLPADWNRPDNELSARSLQDLRELLSRERLRGPGAHPAANTAQVAAVLARVVQSESTPTSWWMRFKDWLRRLLAPRAQQVDDGLLRHWLSELDLSRSLQEAIGWGALALVVLIAASVILNELRVAGLLGERERGTRRRVDGTDLGPDCITLEEIEGAEATARPGMLLAFIAARLAALDRVPAARALTARELWQRAQLPDERARSAFGELVAVCERLRFSGMPVPLESLDAAFADGRSVLATLDGGGVTPGGGA
jgi:hypothetical protein